MSRPRVRGGAAQLVGGQDHRLTNPTPGDQESFSGELVVLVVVVVLRAGTLGLGAAETVGSGSSDHRLVVIFTLAALAGQSALTFATAAWRLRRLAAPLLSDGTAIVETVAGAAALVVVAYATPAGLRVTSSFWVEPYTVISALVLAAAVRRAAVGALGALFLTVTYLLCVLVLAPGGAQLSAAERASAWTNALSYLPFFAVGAIGFGLVRAIVGQTEALRRMLSRLSSERARVAAAASAYRVGHDIPKALLREVRRGAMGAEQLRPWAARYRDDLLDALSGDVRPVVDLRHELGALTSAFASAVALRVDLGALRADLPPGTPALLIAEAARELLNNASYHAFGYPATLTARSTPVAVEVIVHNGGPGLDPTLLRSTWARKQNTLHHLEAAGGDYQIASEPGSPAGTTVTLTWPAVSFAARGESAPGPT